MVESAPSQRKKAITDRLDELRLEIAEIRKRMPAHSVGPAIMAELLDLEDERDQLLAKGKRIP